jgi:hypothetical protein
VLNNGKTFTWCFHQAFGLILNLKMLNEKFEAIAQSLTLFPENFLHLFAWVSGKSFESNLGSSSSQMPWQDDIVIRSMRSFSWL